MILIEAHNRDILPTNDDTLYVSVLPNSNSCKEIKRYIDNVNINEFLSEEQFRLYPEDEYHTTLVYSRAAGPILYELTLNLVERKILETVKATPKEFAVFGNCLVLLLESPSLQEVFEQYIAAGASYDFPDYQPHITVGKFSDDSSRGKLVAESLANMNNKLNNLVVVFDAFSSEPLDPEKS